jgi:putative ABC transport system substrate-binding protein
MSICLRRREFIAGLGGAAAWPLATRAQQPAMPVIGFLRSTTAAVLPYDRLPAFRRGLEETGFAEGRNVAIEFRFADDQRERLPAMAADLVRRRVAVIVANGVSLSAAMAATSTIPIVFVGGTDPVAQGLIISLNHPSGNVTGTSFNNPALSAKRLQLLHEFLPKPTVTAVLLDSNGTRFEAQLQDVGAAARTLGRQIVVVKATNDRELDTAFTAMLQAAVGALFVGSSAFFTSRRWKLVGFATDHALPASYEAREFVELGGLMSYGAGATDSYRRGGIYVGRILKGTKPSDLPLELPTKYELVFNLATAKKLGLKISPKLLVLADEVIE